MGMEMEMEMVTRPKKQTLDFACDNSTFLLNLSIERQRDKKR